MPDVPPSDLILASTSPYRRELLRRLGVPFRCLAPGVDEEMYKASASGPRALAVELARAKATALARDHPAATLIGSDQVVAFRGRVLGKPGTIERAIEQLAAMAGQSHVLITALAVCHRGEVVAHADVATLHMRSLSREEITRVVEADRPIDCAGGYKLEARGITLFERIEADDQTAIVGLPLMALTTILREFGYRIP